MASYTLIGQGKLLHTYTCTSINHIFGKDLRQIHTKIETGDMFPNVSTVHSMHKIYYANVPEVYSWNGCFCCPYGCLV